MTRALLFSRDLEVGRDFKEILEVEEFEVTWVHTVAEAVYHATHTRFNLVMQEIYIRDESTLDLAEALTIYDPSLPIIGYAFKLERREKVAIANISFKRVFCNPISVEELLKFIHLYTREDDP